MSKLSASAEIVLNYAKLHKNEDGITEFSEDIDTVIGFPKHIIINACEELKSKGYIRNYAESEESVEYVEFF